MKDLNAYPTQDILEELMVRENCPDLAIIYSHVDNENKPEECSYDIFFKGDPKWLLKKVTYNLMPLLEEAEEEQYEDDSEED